MVLPLAVRGHGEHRGHRKAGVLAHVEHPGCGFLFSRIKIRFPRPDDRADKALPERDADRFEPLRLGGELLLLRRVGAPECRRIIHVPETDVAALDEEERHRLGLKRFDFHAPRGQLDDGRPRSSRDGVVFAMTLTRSVRRRTLEIGAEGDMGIRGGNRPSVVCA